MRFGEKLRDLRTDRAMTQAEVAEEIGVSLRTVVSYETGKSYPKQRRVYQKLAKLFDVNPDYLLTEGDGPMREKDADDAGFVDRAAATYGSRGKRQAQDLVAQVSGMFAGGELSEDDKDAVMRALQQAYWDAKEENRKGAK